MKTMPQKTLAAFVAASCHSESLIRAVVRQTRSRFNASVGVAACVLALSNGAMAQYPAQGTDTTTSLGQFTIVVNPAYVPFISGANTPAGFTYDSGKNLLTSPLLFDPSTSIDRSSSTTVGSAAYNTGLTVGSPANGTVKASDLTLPPNYTPTAGEDTVFTKIRTFTLASGGTSVTAGGASTQPASKGEVVSNATGAGIGVPANDFPATSFFDIFVDITIPGVGSPFINGAGEPLLVKNNAIGSFPPVVIYTHGNSNSVSILFTSGNAFGQPAGALFGEMVLAGHGAGYTNATSGGATDQNTGLPANSTTFNAKYQQMLNDPNHMMPLPAAESSWSTFVPSTPEPASLALMASGMAALGLRRGRRPTSPLKS